MKVWIWQPKRTWLKTRQGVRWKGLLMSDFVRISHLCCIGDSSCSWMVFQSVISQGMRTLITVLRISLSRRYRKNWKKFCRTTLQMSILWKGIILKYLRKGGKVYVWIFTTGVKGISVFLWMEVWDCQS